MENTLPDLRPAAARFVAEDDILSVEPLGNGLINDTFKVCTVPGTPDYVLQRINDAIFADVDLLQHNIETVTRHIRRRLAAAGEEDLDRKVLRFVPDRQTGKTWWQDARGRYWRMSVFIPDAYTYETVNPEYSYYAGLGFGRFEAQLADLEEPLGETIPDFHNMELRLRQLVEAVRENRAGRLGEQAVVHLLEDIDRFGETMCRAEQLHRDGILPKRICHCDTKVNNMLFDRDGQILCIIDLDTVMPAYVFSDYGDFLRTAANTRAEDDPDIDGVSFNMEIFKAFTRGYLESAGEFLLPVETDNLPYAACLFPFMQAVRFLTDYLNGDTYYKVRYPEHNLVRTRNQIRLFHDAWEKVPRMTDFIHSLA